MREATFSKMKTGGRRRCSYSKADDSTTGRVGVGGSEKNVRQRRRERAQASEESLGAGEGGDDPPRSQAKQRRRRVTPDKAKYRSHDVITDTAAQHAMPSGSEKVTQDSEERVGSGKAKETPEMGESEEGKIAQADRQPRPLGGEGRAEVPWTNNTGEHDVVRRHAGNETTTEGSLPKPGPTQT